MRCKKQFVAVLALLTVQTTALFAQQPPANSGPAAGMGPAQAAAPQAATQQTRQVPLMNTQQAVDEGIAQVRERPFPQLSPQEQQYLEQVLTVWEQRTEKVTHFECDFKRWQYDPLVHAESPSTIAAGKIKFMDPDKGLFKVSEIKHVAGKGSNPEYRVDPNAQFGEHWICDGNWVHVLDANTKKAVRYELPPSMRGEAIYRSPLPFLFGVKADEIMQRYWIHPVTPPEGDDSVWLEAYPKRADDAGNYKKVQIVLDRKDILPKALIVFLPNWRPEQAHREIYEFSNRNDNANSGAWNAIQRTVLQKEFIPTKLPGDWEVIEEPYIPPEQQPNQIAQPPVQNAPLRR